MESMDTPSNYLPCFMLALYQVIDARHFAIYTSAPALCLQAYVLYKQMVQGLTTAGKKKMVNVTSSGRALANCLAMMR